jgi:hypothetical protein
VALSPSPVSHFCFFCIAGGLTAADMKLMLTTVGRPFDATAVTNVLWDECVRAVRTLDKLPENDILVRILRFRASRASDTQVLVEYECVIQGFQGTSWYSQNALEKWSDNNARALVDAYRKKHQSGINQLCGLLFSSGEAKGGWLYSSLNPDEIGESTREAINIDSGEEESDRTPPPPKDQGKKRRKPDEKSDSPE